MNNELWQLFFETNSYSLKQEISELVHEACELYLNAMLNNVHYNFWFPDAEPGEVGHFEKFIENDSILCIYSLDKDETTHSIFIPLQEIGVTDWVKGYAVVSQYSPDITTIIWATNDKDIIECLTDQKRFECKRLFKSDYQRIIEESPDDLLSKEHAEEIMARPSIYLNVVKRIKFTTE